MTPAQVRMARAALDWSLGDLAQASGIDQSIIADLESGRDAGRPEALAAIRAAFEAAGVVFLEEGVNGPGMRLREGLASEVDTAFQEMLRTLRQGQAALQVELDMLASAPTLEPELLRRLRGSAAEFAGQASFLATRMAGRDKALGLMDEAKQLLSFFQLIRDQFASLLEGGWASAKEKASDETEV